MLSSFVSLFDYWMDPLIGHADAENRRLKLEIRHFVNSCLEYSIKVDYWITNLGEVDSLGSHRFLGDLLQIAELSLRMLILHFLEVSVNMLSFFGHES